MKQEAKPPLGGGNSSVEVRRRNSNPQIPKTLRVQDFKSEFTSVKKCPERDSNPQVLTDTGF